jgi:hypothetical protein
MGNSPLGGGGGGGDGSLRGGDCADGDTGTALLGKHRSRAGPVEALPTKAVRKPGPARECILRPEVRVDVEDEEGGEEAEAKGRLIALPTCATMRFGGMSPKTSPAKKKSPSKKTTTHQGCTQFCASPREFIDNQEEKTEADACGGWRHTLRCAAARARS